MTGINHSQPSISHLCTELAGELAALRDRIGASLYVSPLGKPKVVADATTKAIIRTRCGRPIAVIVVSPPNAPDIIDRGARRAEDVRALLNEHTAAPIIAPLFEGRVGGLSYVVLPWFRPLTASRVHWIWQRTVLRRPILRWLRNATAESVRSNARENNSAMYEQTLQDLRRQSILNGEISRVIDFFLERLRDKTWQPLHTFEHNDLYHGNVLLRPCTPRNKCRNGTHSYKYPFVLIDWGSANPRGFGMYDLLRICRSLKVPARQIAEEVKYHCGVLSSDPEDAPGHLLASLGSLYANREHLSHQRYMRLFHACWSRLNRALEVDVARTM